MIARYILSLAPSLKAFIALTAAMLDPGCLAGHSAQGLPYVIPAVACFILLGRGWMLFGAEEWKWRLLSLAYLLGASMFATTPLSRSIGVVLWPWELVPFAGVAVLMGVEGWQAMRSRWSRFRALAICTATAIVCAVIAPWIPPLAESFPHLVIFGVYGSLGAVLFADIYCHRPTARRQPA